MDSAVVENILHSANAVLPIKECIFIGDKGYDAKAVYNLVKDVYGGEAVIPLNKRRMKDPKKLSVDNPICGAGLAMHKDGKTTDHGRTRQKFCCPFRQPKPASALVTTKIGIMGRRTEVMLDHKM